MPVPTITASHVTDSGSTMIAPMLALISLDAAALPLLERMRAEGRLPHLDALARRGRTYAMTTTPLHASIYRTLYTGRSLTAHGVHYPLQWSPSEQRVRPTDPLEPEDSVFVRLTRAGRRMLVIDPPECGLFTPGAGIAVSGWQFTTRFVLPHWYSSHRVARALEDRFGPPERCHEVFGPPTASRLRAMHHILESAPGRLADAAAACLRMLDVDLLWVTFVAAHIAGHQLWRSSFDTPAPIAQEPRMLAGIYEKIDEALGRLLAALPANADVILFSPNGMGPETSRSDMLPAMLARVLDAGARSRAAAPPANALWRLRAAVPTNLRALIAGALPDRFALEVAARLENTGTDWKRTRAFAPPSDGPGFVRLNLQGRERDGIVESREAASLLDEIAAGLETFRDASGERVVASILRRAELGAPGPKSEALPDLVVVWNRQLSGQRHPIVSDRFGEVRRQGVGSGRTGNHPGAAWAVVVPGASRTAAADLTTVEAVDLPATICAAMDVPHADLPGRSLLLPSRRASRAEPVSARVEP